MIQKGEEMLTYNRSESNHKPSGRENQLEKLYNVISSYGREALQCE